MDVEQRFSAFEASAHFQRFSLADCPPFIDVRAEFAPDCVVLASEEAILRAPGRLVLNHDQPRPPVGLRLVLDRFAGRVNMNCRGDNVWMALGRLRRFNMGITAYSDVSIVVGDGSSCNGAEIFAADADIVIGEDCMLSSEILLQAGDQHGIIDIVEEQIVNSARRTLRVGDHVWLGRRVSVLADASIGEGSIVGTAAVVAKALPTYCVAVGNPARVVRTGMTWSRALDRVDDMAARVVERARAATGAQQP